LKQTDYYFVASNRIYGSIRHLPWRYAMQDKFYELLYQGKLGFEHVYGGGTVAGDQVVPHLFGIKFNDQSADESFTVYDHPRVDVFKKTSDLSDDSLRML